jgi:hypothetical protein
LNAFFVPIKIFKGVKTWIYIILWDGCIPTAFPFQMEYSQIMPSQQTTLLLCEKPNKNIVVIIRKPCLYYVVSVKKQKEFVWITEARSGNVYPSILRTSP